MNKTSVTLSAAVLLACASTAAHAIPFVMGSFALTNMSTSTSTDVTTTTDFPLGSATVTVADPIGSFAAAGAPALPATVTLGPGALDFTTSAAELAGFNFNAGPTVGSFVATGLVNLGHTSIGGSVSQGWGVVGTWTLGSGWDNAGTVLSGSETFALSQTGGAPAAISISGTFNSPSAVSTVPEPISLALFGSGLVGAFLVRRRKSKA